MDFDALSEGIAPGGLRNKDDIRLLICYVLHTVDKPMSVESLTGILQETELANYFEAVDACHALIQSGNIAPTEEDETLYTVTSSGRLVSSQLEDELPPAVRDKAVGAALMLLNRLRAEKENAVHIKKLENGYRVNCSISGGDTELFSCSLYVPEESQARTVKRNFRRNPDLVYNVMIATLTRNRDLAKTALEEIESTKK